MRDQPPAAIERKEGRAVEVVTAGTFGPTVVFESGLGNDWAPWDRGPSAPTATPRDAGHIVEELRALLRARGHAPSFLLVGREQPRVRGRSGDPGARRRGARITGIDR